MADVQGRVSVKIADPTTGANQARVTASGNVGVDIGASITLTVDSELPAAAALTDNFANPTAPGVGAFAMLWDGATWDRWPGNSAAGASVQGNVAADAAVTANPLLNGGRASSAIPTAMSTDGDAVQLWLDRSGGTIVNGRDAHDAALDANTNPQLIGGRASAAAPTDVSADGDAVRAWFLRNGAQATVITAAGTLISATGTSLNANVTNTVTVDTELSTAAAAADGFANPTSGGVLAFLMGWNGTTWDRVDTANTGRLQVDVITGGGTETPTNPVLSTQTSASLAAGSSVALTTAEATSKKLRKVVVWASVPFKATLTTVDNASESAVKAYGGGAAFSPWTFDTPHRNYITLGATAGLDAFRVNVTNLDNNSAADVYASFYYED
jgi:hypothetical protein